MDTESAGASDEGETVTLTPLSLAILTEMQDNLAMDKAAIVEQALRSFYAEMTFTGSEGKQER